MLTSPFPFGRGISTNKPEKTASLLKQLIPTRLYLIFKTPDPTSTLLKDEPEPTSLSSVAPHELIFLMALGEDLQAHPSIVHGGFQAIIFDEIMRLLILLHQNNVCKPGPRDIHYTANMTVSYSAPVIAPSNVLVRSRLVRREGRKWFTKGEIVNSEGQILTSAESMWITAKIVGRS
jgi:acyl-coenzyme A thioesterase PaaI-like protein